MIWNTIAVLLSLASFAVSLYALWVTQLRRGHLQMTQPTLIFMGREGADLHPKIFLRTLLFCTADRGCIIECMHLKVRNEFGTYSFDVWAYGETNKLSVGSGLFVPRSGVSFNHHFVLRHSEPPFLFASGEYELQLFAKVLGQRKALRLTDLRISLDGNQGPTMLQVRDAGAFLEWDVEAEKYIGRIEWRQTPFG
jgi:hypothetical protein